MKSYRKILVPSIFLTIIILLSSCGNGYYELSDDSEADVFCRTFIERVIAGEKEETYDMVGSIGTEDTFERLWSTFRTSANGAASADICMTEFWFYTENGFDYFKGQYFVQFDNGSCMNLSLVFEDGISIREVIYLDITDFYVGAEKTADVVNLVLTIYSVLAVGFCGWMIVDCVRRPIQKKALWLLAIIACAGLTVRIGEYFTMPSFMLALPVPFSGAAIDLSYLAVAVKVVVPVGAIVYFCQRKRLPVIAEPVEAVNIE